MNDNDKKESLDSENLFFDLGCKFKFRTQYYFRLNLLGLLPQV